MSSLPPWVRPILVDHVAEGNGKLYINGGAWNVFNVEHVPTRLPHLGVAVVLHVPWTATNQMHSFALTLRDEDGNQVPLGGPADGSADEPQTAIEGQFNVGRPPNVPAGDEQIVPLPINIGGLAIEKSGGYCFVIALDGDEVKTLGFRVNVRHPGEISH